MRRSESPELNFDYVTLKEYKEQLDLEKDKIETIYQNYFTKPSDYPQYKDEWIKFWNSKREKHGVNINNYDFTDEWRDFILSRLRALKRSELADFKKNLIRKFNMKQKKRNKQSTQNFRKSRSRTRTHTSSDETSDDERNGHVPSSYRKPNGYKYKSNSLVDVCSDITRLNCFVINRKQIYNLLDKARSHERLHNQEYVMNEAECNLLKRYIRWLQSTLLAKKTSKRFPLLRTVLSKLQNLVEKWENTVGRDNLHSSISSSSSVNVSSRGETNNKLSEYMDRLNFFMNQEDTKKFDPLILGNIKSEPCDIFCVKQEKLEDESILKLMEKNGELLKQIVDEPTKLPYLLEQTYCADLNNEKTTNLDAVNKLNSTVENIPDEELILHLNNLENLSEEQQLHMLQIMSDIETKDKQRFDRLKGFIFKDDQLQ